MSRVDDYVERMKTTRDRISVPLHGIAFELPCNRHWLFVFACNPPIHRHAVRIRTFRTVLRFGDNLLTSTFRSKRIPPLIRMQMLIGNHALSASDHQGTDRRRSMSKPMLPSLRKYRDLLLYRQSPEEAACIQQIAHQLRNLRAAYHLTREELATKLEIDRELLVIVENGDGNPETAHKLLELSLVALRDATV